MIGHPLGNPVLRLFLYTTLVLVLTMAATGFYAFGVSQRYLLPEIDLKARAVGTAVADKVALAQHYGIPFDRLVGMEAYLGSIVQAQPEIAYLAVTNPEGRLVYHAGRDAAELNRVLGTAPRHAPLNPARRVHLPDESWAVWLSRTSLELTAPLIDYAVPTRGYYDTKVPLVFRGETMGMLHVGVSVAFYQKEIADQVADMVIALIVALMVAFELLLAATTLTLSGPLDTLLATVRQGARGVLVRPLRGSAREIDGLAERIGRVVEALEAALNGVRARLAALRIARPERATQVRLDAVARDLDAVLPPAATSASPVDRASAFIGARIGAFLFVLAEEMARPFMPVFIQGVAEADGLGGSDLVIGLPMSLFLLVVALSMPSVSAWSERFGRRRTFALGAALSSLALIATALDPTYGEVLLWRAVSGLGYAMTFVACQGHVLDHAGTDGRARGVAVFVGGITAADICGPALGGMLAARIGFDAVLALGGVLAGLGAVLGLWALRQRGGIPPVPMPRGQRLWSLLRLLKNGRFTVLLLLSAMPAKLLLSGALFFLLPLVASAEGATQAEIGRLVMIYGLAGFLLATPFARQADRWRLHGLMVGAGGILAGVGMMPLVFETSQITLAIAVLGLGAGQAMSISPQLALVLRVCEAEVGSGAQASVVGLYRLAERFGGALGPFAASALAGGFGYGGAMAALGAAAATLAVAFSVVFLVIGVKPHPDDQFDDDLVKDGPLKDGPANPPVEGKP